MIKKIAITALLTVSTASFGLSIAPTSPSTDDAKFFAQCSVAYTEVSMKITDPKTKEGLLRTARGAEVAAWASNYFNGIGDNEDELDMITGWDMSDYVGELRRSDDVDADILQKLETCVGKMARQDVLFYKIKAEKASNPVAFPREAY